MTRPRLLVYDETGELYPELSRYTDEVEVLGVSEPEQIGQQLEESPANALVLNAATPEALMSYMEALRDRRGGLPLIGCSIPRSVSRAEQLGAVCHLVKPVTRDDLYRALAMVDRPVKRILLIDDEPEVLQLWTRMLHIHDRALEVVTVGDGRRALEVMDRIGPDLVVLDVIMAGMDGWQVLEHMNQQEATREIPVIVVSAQDPHTALPATPYLVATCGDGLSVGKLLRCSLNFSSVMLGPDRAPGPAPR
jgi:CheY-like chemotaxis protein